MEEILREQISHRPRTTLKLKATLVPIEQYAAREGVSVKCIEKCAQLGMFYLRKYKGKVFVVDIPPDAYLSDSAITEDAEQTYETDDAASAGTVDNIAAAETSDKSVTAAAFPQLVKKLLNRSCELAEKHYGPFDPPLNSPENNALPAEFDEFIDDTELDRIIYETLNIKPSCEADEIIGVPYEKTATARDPSALCDPDEIKLVEEDDGDEKLELNDEFFEGQDAPFDPMKDFAKFEAEPDAPHSESRRSWQFAAAFLVILLLAAILGMFWFSLINPAIVQKTDYAPQAFQSKLEPAQVRQPANTGNPAAQTPENGILLENSIMQVENLRSDLSRFRQDYQALSERNALALQRLDDEIKRLAAQSPTTQ